jgi:hypothetical protein
MRQRRELPWLDPAGGLPPCPLLYVDPALEAANRTWRSQIRAVDADAGQHKQPAALSLAVSQSSRTRSLPSPASSALLLCWRRRWHKAAWCTCGAGRRGDPVRRLVLWHRRRRALTEGAPEATLLRARLAKVEAVWKSCSGAGSWRPVVDPHGDGGGALLRPAASSPRLPLPPLRSLLRPSARRREPTTVIWTSLGPLPRWVPGPTTRWAPRTTRLALHDT